MKPLVIDASVAVAIVRREPARDVVRAILRERGRAQVPAFFWLEIVNVLGRRYRYPGAAILEAVRELDELGFDTVETDVLIRLAVIDMVERFSLSAYDAAYLALAEVADAQLLTLDRNLAAAARGLAILVGPEGRIKEVGGPYEVEPTWPRWRGAAAYLGELRRRAATPT
jgi:predicted nucleic acid-binding protein